MLSALTKPLSKRWLAALLGGLAAIVLAILLSRGTARGDESLPIQDAARLWAGDVKALFLPPDAPWLAHRFLWFLEKSAWQGVLLSLVPSIFRRSALMRDALMVMDSVLFMFAALAVMMHHLLRRGYAWPLASLTVGSLLFASSAISFFSGGVLECQMTFYAVVIAAILDSPGAHASLRWAGFLAASALLVFCKSYALLVLLPLALLLPPGRERTRYILAIAIAAGFWVVVERLVGGPGGISSVYEGLLGSPTLGAVLEHFGEFFVAFPFGIIWCFPLLGLAAFAGKEARRALILKTAGIILLAGFLSLFVFWHGGGAVAGPRFIVPFLMLLFPELAAGLAALLQRWRWTGFAVPLLTVLFLPSLDYHNGLIFRWGGEVNDYRQWGEADPLMQPGILAWRVVFAKISDAGNFRPSGRINLTVRTDAIIPMTGVSRVSYVLSDHGTDPDQIAAKSWLMDHGLACPAFWDTLRGAVAGGLLLWLVLAAAWARPPLHSRPAP